MKILIVFLSVLLSVLSVSADFFTDVEDFLKAGYNSSSSSTMNNSIKKLLTACREKKIVFIMMDKNSMMITDQGTGINLTGVTSKNREFIDFIIRNAEKLRDHLIPDFEGKSIRSAMININSGKFPELIINIQVQDGSFQKVDSTLQKFMDICCRPDAE